VAEASSLGSEEVGDVAGAEPDFQEHGFEFHGTASEYFRIWVVNLVLTLVTFGVYSAWAKVRTQQYLASSTHLAGASFAYLADPMAILRGRAIVVGFFLVYFTASLVSTYLEFAMSIAMVLAIPWAVVRSMSFRAHNTAWRNIRFGFRADYGPAFGAYIGYPLLGTVTLGVLYPDAIFRQRRFIVNNASYGSTDFQIGSRSGQFYRLFGLVLLLVVVMSITVGLGVGLVGGQAILGAVLIALPFYFMMFGLIAAGISNLTYEGAQLGSHRLSSKVPAVGLATVYASNAMAMLLSLGLLIPWARIRVLRFRLRHMSVRAAGSLDDFVARQADDVGGAGAELGESFGLDLGL